jgi:adenylyl- and sulfurtransferase ThiI
MCWVYTVCGVAEGREARRRRILGCVFSELAMSTLSAFSRVILIHGDNIGTVYGRLHLVTGQVGGLSRTIVYRPLISFSQEQMRYLSVNYGTHRNKNL